MKTLIYNAIETPDGTLLVSRDTHDYVTHYDTVAKETYVLDGGLDYRRMSVNSLSAKDKSVYLEDGIEAFRDLVEWGTYGKDGKGLFRRVKLSQMETSHIQAILDTQNHISKAYRKAFEMELEYRDNQPDCSGGFHALHKQGLV